MQKIKAVIFDMDGVISDTQKLHSRVESDILNRFGINIGPEEITDRYAGVKTSEFISELLTSSGSRYDIESIMKEKWLEMERLANIGVDEVPGSVDLIRSLKEGGYKLAVASASDFNYVSSVLRQLEVMNMFGSVVSGDMVKKGKPDPESFLLAAQNIYVSPQSCLVIEDGRSGMEAAKRAGMCCVGLVKNPRNDYPTSNLVTTLQSITIDYINSL